MTLTPREFATANPTVSRSIGLPPVEHYMLFCDDDAGQHWTIIGTDGQYFKMVKNASPEVLADLVIPTEKFPVKRAGWPDEWTK